jgi:hypothetical protein
MIVFILFSLPRTPTPMTVPDTTYHDLSTMIPPSFPSLFQKTEQFIIIIILHDHLHFHILAITVLTPRFLSIVF